MDGLINFRDSNKRNHLVIVENIKLKYRNNFELVTWGIGSEVERVIVFEVYK